MRQKLLGVITATIGHERSLLLVKWHQWRNHTMVRPLLQFREAGVVDTPH